MSSPRSLAFAAPWIATVVILLALAAEACSRRTPAPLPADVAGDRFAAGRALEIVRHLLGDGAPHPVGSEANARVRDGIESDLRALGLSPERQSTFVCRGERVCAPVVNVLARIPGELESPAVLLVSHYDSVHAGPGAGDDTHGVAVMLEVARALVADGPRRHPVVLLFDEGEEVGLLGAEAFVRAHPLALQVGAVVNIEARGTEGRTSMFETAAGNAELVQRYAEAVPDPEATSLAVEVYRRMPNDTDFTVLREAGMVGFNLAFIGGVARYHTPLDDLAHLDAGSVQHQGDTVLALTRALADELPTVHDGDAAFTDLLGIGMIAWAAGWSAPALALALVGLVVVTVIARRRGRVRLRGIGLGFACVLAMLALPTLVGVGLVQLVAAAQGAGVAALAHPLPLRIGVWGATSAAAIAVAIFFARRMQPSESVLATWLSWAALGLAFVASAPGVAPLFVLPVLPGAAAITIGVLRPRVEVPAFAIALAPFALLWAALAFGLEDAFGWSLAAAVVLPIAAITTPAAWAFGADSSRRPGRSVLVVSLALALVGGATAMSVDVHDRDSPRRLTLVHYEDRDAAESWLLISPSDAPLPETLREAAAVADPPRAMLPWTRARMWAAPAVTTDLHPPRLTVSRAEPTPAGRRIHARLTSPRGADRAVLMATSRTALHGLRIGGEPVDLAGEGPLALHVFGLPAGGVELELEIASTEPFGLRVVDCSAELPEREVARARDLVGVPAQWGDGSCIALGHRL